MSEQPEILPDEPGLIGEVSVSHITPEGVEPLDVSDPAGLPEPPEPEVSLLDPRTGEERMTYRPGRILEVVKAIGRASGAATGWVVIPARERRKALAALATYVADNIDPLAYAEEKDRPITAEQAFVEAHQAVDLIDFWAARSSVRPEPLIDPIGLVLPASPRPLVTLVGLVMPLLAAGRCVIARPHPQTPGAALFFERLVAESLGPDLLIVVPGDRITGRLVAGLTGDDDSTD